MNRRALERLLLFAREDARDSVRERQAHVLGVLFVLIGAGMAYVSGSSTVVRAELAPQLLGPFALLVPLVTLGLVASALVEKRSTGALTVLLGLPFSRGTVLLGTLLGRCVVIGTAVVTAMVISVPVALARDVTVVPLDFVIGTVGLLALAVTFTAIAVSISAITRTSTRASFAAFGAYVLFVFQLWVYLPMAVVYVLNGFEYPETTPTWIEFIAALNPLTAFTNALAGFSRSLAEATMFSVPTEPELYERPAVAVAILLAWTVVSTGYGYRRFRATDI